MLLRMIENTSAIAKTKRPLKGSTPSVSSNTPGGKNEAAKTNIKYELLNE